jgi:hypothetical protein
MGIQGLKPLIPRLRHDIAFGRTSLCALVATDGFSAGFRDYSGNRYDARFAAGYRPTLQPGSAGPCWAFDANTGHSADTGTFPFPTTSGTAAVVFLAPPASGTVRHLFASSASSTGLYFLRLTASGALAFDVAGTILTSAPPAASFFGAWHTAIARFNATSMDIWLDGVLVASSGTGATITPSGYLRVGTSNTDVLPCLGAIDSLFIHNVRWSSGECLRWSADPWWALRSRRDRPMFRSTSVFTGSGGSSLSSLTASASASFTAPSYTSSSAVTLSDLSLASTASYAGVDLNGSGTPALANLTVAAGASYTGIVTPYRDRDAYDSIISLLNATGEFDVIVFASTPNRDNLPPSARRVCVISPTRQPGFTHSNDGSPGRRYHRVSYTLTLKVIEENTEDAYALMDRLDAVVHNALESVAYGGFTIPWQSTLTTGKTDDTRHPEYRMAITGTFAYVVESHVGFSTLA